VDPGEDEESCIVYYQVEVLGTLGGRPAAPLIPGGHLPGRGAEAEHGRQLSFRAPYEIAYRGTNQLACAKVVKLVEEFVKRARLATLPWNGKAKEPKGTKGLSTAGPGSSTGLLADQAITG